jgi:RecA/RadA recombinase
MRRPESHLRLGFLTADKLMNMRIRISTGIHALDELLGGGLELGLMHLFYGDRSLHNDLLRIAVHVQLPKDRVGVDSPTIMIDSANIIKVDKLRDYAFELELEPEEVMDRIYLSRAFNASQTYDLVMTQLERFFDRVPAKLLIVAGLPDLYIKEGLTGEGAQQLTHMATKLMALTLNRRIVTIVTAPLSEKNRRTPAGGKALTSCAQIHVRFSESKSYFKYILTKHPQYPIKRTSRSKPVMFGTTLPLSYFIGDDSSKKDEDETR